MTTQAAAPPGFFRTVWLLLAVARKRARGRYKRQLALLRQRAPRHSLNFGWFGLFFMILITAMINGLAATCVGAAVQGGQRVMAEHHGLIMVDGWFARRVEAVELRAAGSTNPADEIDRALRRAFRNEARSLARDSGEAPDDVEARLRAAVESHGAAGLAAAKMPWAALKSLPAGTSLPALLGSLVLLIWSVMLVFQGEGLELDIQRRRHPVWEYLFSHPVPLGAIFFADMLSPFAANPIFFSAPIFPGLLYGFVYGLWPGIAATILIGLPVAISASCLGKATEIAVLLRCAPRSRGAVIGVMGWLGYSTMMLFLVATAAAHTLLIVAAALRPVAELPWPELGLFLGQLPDGGFSFLAGMLTCWAVAGATMAASVGFSVWGAQRGLSGGAVAARPARVRTVGFGRNAMQRKELLWFTRDRSALVQAILVPMTLAGFQVLNLRGLLRHAQGGWSDVCGAGIVFGTYFLWVLGPKSLASEGAALWIATTWPHGLEGLLKAKAWLWTLLSCGIVGMVLCYAAILYPQSIWKIALVGVGWFLFARSMADKAVTLATITTESGEAEKVPQGRRASAQLGMLTFCVGIISQRWDLAIIGIVFSMMTAAAMWQNFRARLPFLHDPWSEQLPPPPTLMHAMIAISLLVEAGAVLSGGLLVLAGRNTVAVLQALLYGVCAAAVSIGMAFFLRRRDVRQSAIWFWLPAARGPAWKGLMVPLLVGVACGLALGIIGTLYKIVLSDMPLTSALLHRSDAAMAAIPHLRLSVFVMAVLIAPVAEEYLFRGLLFRALDREWGGWRAVLGSAAFFASYHPALSWPPVALLGVCNAVLFKRTGQLFPAVVTHAIYNAIVLA